MSDNTEQLQLPTLEDLAALDRRIEELLTDLRQARQVRDGIALILQATGQLPGAPEEPMPRSGRLPRGLTQEVLLRALGEHPGSTRQQLWRLVQAEVPAMGHPTFGSALSRLKDTGGVRAENGRYYLPEAVPHA